MILPLLRLCRSMLISGLRLHWNGTGRCKHKPSVLPQHKIILALTALGIYPPWRSLALIKMPIIIIQSAVAAARINPRPPFPYDCRFSQGAVLFRKHDKRLQITKWLINRKSLHVVPSSIARAVIIWLLFPSLSRLRQIRQRSKRVRVL